MSTPEGQQSSDTALPVIALVGRPNVGKSTLFNVLTGSRDALVADVPGLTRDRQYGYGRFEERHFIVVDTGGMVAGGSDDQFAEAVLEQTEAAIREADAICFLVDAKAGLTEEDRRIAGLLRKNKKDNTALTLVVNKTEGLDAATGASDFFELGFDDWYAIAAAHKRGINKLLTGLLPGLEQASQSVSELLDSENPDAIRIALIGRPNAGKSTLLNRLLGEERVLASEIPGTTRDSVAVPFERDGHDYVLIDTAGVRRRAKVEEGIERLSVIKTLEAVERAHVVIAMLDGQAGISAQDARLIGLVTERGRALVVAVNKWDGLDETEKNHLRIELERKLPFLDFALKIETSALHGTGVGKLIKAARSAYIAAHRDMSTPELTRELEVAVRRHQPPLVSGRRIKLRYAHQGGHNPPVIVIHGNQTQRVSRDYRRYLINHFRQVFRLDGTPVRLEFKTGDNPFKGRRNKLTPRQQRSRKRMLKHHRK